MFYCTYNLYILQVTSEPGEETAEVDANDKEPELEMVRKLGDTPGIIVINCRSIFCGWNPSIRIP